ncbi:MAG: hypothetical protein HY898_02890 [Deltaproteobacteria bacterium]|nr:hypothetical protein [Deltaproteobacteria bacterium]
MVYWRWKRLAQLAILVTVVPSVLGAFGGIIAAVVMRSPSFLVVTGAAFVYMVPSGILSMVTVGMHARTLRKAIADQLGLPVVDNKVQGVLEGVEIDTVTVRTSGRNGTNRAMFRFRIFGPGIGCQVYPTRGYQRCMNDEPEVLTGDPVFDPRFVVNSRDANAARTYLDGRKRQLLLQLDEACRRMWFLRPDGLFLNYGNELGHDDETGAALIRSMTAWAKALMPAGR